MLLISCPIISRLGFTLRQLSSGSYRLATMTFPDGSNDGSLEAAPLIDLS